MMVTIHRRPFHSVPTCGRGSGGSSSPTSVSRHWWGCRELTSPPQTGVSNSRMWQLASLFLFVTFWGISSTPATLGKASLPPHTQPSWDPQSLPTASPEPVQAFHISSELQALRTGYCVNAGSPRGTS